MVTPVPAAPLRVFQSYPEALQAARARSPRDPALAALRRRADAALTVPLQSVTNKTQLPPSGDIHDYYSLAPYYWPNPNTPDGLPYIRRDGQVAPATQAYQDRAALERMLTSVNTLTLAAFILQETPYAERAALLLRTWFLDPATRMNPHLTYAQQVPGDTTVRGFGIIETHDLPLLFDSIGLIEGSPTWSAQDDQGMRAWFTTYLEWLRSSPQGQQEAMAPNNHGSWYDYQVAAIALYLGQSVLAEQTLQHARQRIGVQIQPDGTQPLEQERTRSWTYSIFNLEALVRLARLGDHVGVDLWNEIPPQGGTLRAVFDYLLPYATGKAPWPGTQITDQQTNTVLTLYRQAAWAYQSPIYAEASQTIAGERAASHQANLVIPAFEGPKGSNTVNTIRAMPT